ncbi:hypothetical protein [Streptomyces sp. NPDC054804]
MRRTPRERPQVPGEAVAEDLIRDGAHHLIDAMTRRDRCGAPTVGTTLEKVNLRRARFDAADHR